MEELLRLARELRPAALDDLGLGAALRTKVDDFDRQRRRRTRRCDLADGGRRRLGAEEQLVVYRVVQESLSNVARHAGAAHVEVDVAPRGRRARVVRDRRRRRAASTRRARDDGIGWRACASAPPWPAAACAVRSPRAAARVELRMPRSGACMSVLIADDHGVVRGGLRLLLDRQADMEVVGEAADGAEAVAADARDCAPTWRSSTSRCRS